MKIRTTHLAPVFVSILALGTACQSPAENETVELKLEAFKVPCENDIQSLCLVSVDPADDFEIPAIDGLTYQWGNRYNVLVEIERDSDKIERVELVTLISVEEEFTQTVDLDVSRSLLELNNDGERYIGLDRYECTDDAICRDLDALVADESVALSGGKIGVQFSVSANPDLPLVLEEVIGPCGEERFRCSTYFPERECVSDAIRELHATSVPFAGVAMRALSTLLTRSVRLSAKRRDAVTRVDNQIRVDV